MLEDIAILTGGKAKSTRTSFWPQPPLEPLGTKVSTLEQNAGVAI
jgi:hypothetical protein